MDLEKLRMILETIEAVGGDAREFGLWYIGLTMGQLFLANVMSLAMGVGVLLTIRHIVRVVISSPLRQISAALGIPVVGTWDHTDTNKIIDDIGRLKSSQK